MTYVIDVIHNIVKLVNLTSHTMSEGYVVVQIT